MWRIDREKGRILYVSREMGGQDKVENRSKKEEEEEGGGGVLIAAILTAIM